jgi:hypothetical protein
MSAATAAACMGCRHFMHEPQSLERALPGLASLSSAYAAVRSHDGVCRLHERYVAWSSSCGRYLAAAAA